MNTLQKTGRPSHIDREIIRLLVEEYPTRLTGYRIAEKLDLRQSSLEHHLGNRPGSLVQRGLVEKGDGYAVGLAHSFDVMLEYYLPPLSHPDKSLVSFLQSPYVESTIFSPIGFNVIWNMAQIKWLRLLGPEALSRWIPFLPDSVGPRPPVKRIMQTLVHLERSGKSSEEISLGLHKEYPAVFDPTAADRDNNYPVLFVSTREIGDMRRAMRLCPSFIRYVATEDSSHGVPSHFLFDSKFLERGGRPDKELAKGISRDANRIFTKFWWRLLSGFLVHDLSTYRVLDDENLLRKCGITNAHDMAAFGERAFKHGDFRT